MINTEWIKCEEQKYFKMGYDAGVLETQIDHARKAPAQTEQKPAVFYHCMNCKHAYEDKPVTSKTEALKLALEALEDLNDTEQTYAAIDRGYAAISAIKEALAQPEQESVAWMTQARNFIHPSECTKSEAKMWSWLPVYTSPPKREWVGLTHEKTRELVGSYGNDPYNLAYKTEEALREKNT